MTDRQADLEQTREIVLTVSADVSRFTESMWQARLSLNQHRHGSAYGPWLQKQPAR